MQVQTYSNMTMEEPRPGVVIPKGHDQPPEGGQDGCVSSDWVVELQRSAVGGWVECPRSVAWCSRVWEGG